MDYQNRSFRSFGIENYTRLSCAAEVEKNDIAYSQIQIFTR